jgi:hypothetical protein
VQGLQDGTVRVLVSGQSYLNWWLIFALVAAIAYYATARMLFASAMGHGLRVGFAAAAAQVAGLFAVVVCFYLVFMFSPVQKAAWLVEITLLLAWFLYFLFSYLTAPASR